MRNINLFKDFSDQEIKALESCVDVRIYRHGDVIVEKGIVARILFVVLEGIVKSDIVVTSVAAQHNQFVAGELFNEVSFFDEQPSHVNFISEGNTKLLALSESALSILVEKTPNVAIKLFLRLLEYEINKLKSLSKFLSKLDKLGEIESRKAIIDEPVGVYNRAFLEEACENFFEISKANAKHLSLLMIDLDNFREINESFGQEIGNKVLVEVVRIIRSITSSHGIIGRYGGDEFCILLPEADIAKAREIAELIRRQVASYDFTFCTCGKSIRITTSIGVSSFPETANELGQLHASADAALYKAKHEGRNKVICANDVGIS
ncbi:MAG: GGDEF domain-containing protein [Spirochaetes bacterium]|nr:GGDEF domain-containing protein [Spirochaetota bacterium]